MTEEYYQGGTCGDNWRWSTASIVAASPCSVEHRLNCGCPNALDMIKSRSTCSGFGFNLSSSTVTSDLNQHLLTGRGESNFHDSMNNDQDFSLDQISRGFPSQLLHSLFDDSKEVVVPQPQQSLFNNVSSSMTYSNSLAENYSTISFNDLYANTDEDEPVVFKRARIETPYSSLPTFKVRKEKLGDRITALQQLVSPFGKTDTASVLHEAIEYLKFLHDQVRVLSTPYVNREAPIENHQGYGKSKNAEKGGKQDLQGRGLCLVPISSTFLVANQTTAEFWTPTSFGVTSFR